MTKSITELMQEAHEIAKEKGWHDTPVSFGDFIANIHAELSEAWEDFRSGHSPTEVWYEGTIDNRTISSHEKNEWCQKPCGIPAELADVVIRVFDTCATFGIDLERVIQEKMAYNRTRPYRHGGKVV